jgi:Concanavalin A-like lectin/glucanases superfamily
MRSNLQGRSSRVATLACSLAILVSAACGGGGSSGTGGQAGTRTDAGVGGQAGAKVDGGAGTGAGGAADAATDTGGTGGQGGMAIDAGIDGAAGSPLPLGISWNAFLPLGAAAPGSSTVLGTTNDLGPNHFDATYYGTTISFTNAALNLTGLGAELVLIPPKNSVPAVNVTASYSVSVWVTLANVDGYRTVISGEGVNIASFFLQKRADTNAWAYTAPPGDSIVGAGCVIPSGPPVDGGPVPNPITPIINTQYHLVATKDSTTGLAILYVNGVESGRGTCPQGWADTGVVGIGHGVFAGNRGDNVQGSIAELGLINRVLTPTEVANLFAAGRAGTVHPDGGTDVAPDIAPDLVPDLGTGEAGPVDAPSDSGPATDAASDGG